MRFINAAAELNREVRRTRLTSIALYTEPDRHAWFVREADEAVCIGPATTFDPLLGRTTLAYLDYDVLERALVAARAEAVWVGWGFVAEHAQFADLCDKLGVVFIGPSGDAMRRVGDKIGSKRLAEEAGLPVVPWSGGPGRRPRRSRCGRGSRRLPAVHQGNRGWRWPGNPTGDGALGVGRRLRRGAHGSSAGVRRPDRVPRTADHRRSSCRGTGCR